MNKWKQAEERARERHAREALEQRGEQLAALVRLHRLLDELRPVLATLAEVEDMPRYQRAFCLQLEGAIYLYDNKIGETPPPEPPTGQK